MLIDNFADETRLASLHKFNDKALVRSLECLRLSDHAEEPFVYSPIEWFFHAFTPFLNWSHYLTVMHELRSRVLGYGNDMSVPMADWGLLDNPLADYYDVCFISSYNLLSALAKWHGMSMLSSLAGCLPYAYWNADTSTVYFIHDSRKKLAEEMLGAGHKDFNDFLAKYDKSLRFL